MNRESLAGERARIDLTWDGELGEGTIRRLRDEVAAGLVELRGDGDVLFVARLEVAPAYRGYGLGTECARLIRERAERGEWRTLRAWAPPNLGLAVYFWSRMGLRPLHGEGSGGGLWFERTVGGK